MQRDVVVLGIVGTQLDRGVGEDRWHAWRPTVDLFRHDDLLIRRLDLLYPTRSRSIAERVSADIQLVSPGTEVRLHLFEQADPWDFEEVYGALHDVARRLAHDPAKEDLLVHVTTGTHVAQICLFLLTEARYLPGRLIQTSPPHRGRSGDLGRKKVIDLDLSRYDKLAQRFHREQEEAQEVLKQGIATRNESFNSLIERIEFVALQSAEPMLLLGPTGAGKSSLARRIHELKLARHVLAGPFVEVNCATLRGDQAMSTLFGHRKGSFTGATGDRDGLLRAADGGLLFLDEIGDLGLDEQAMLLRALEERRFLPLGADQEVGSDFQLVAGTNRDLQERSRKGLFREDLLARINLWTFNLPGLRDRAEDVEPNLDHELDLHAGKLGRRVAFNAEARKRFLDWAVSPLASWPGNFRDFNAALTRLTTLAPSGRITRGLVDEEIARLESIWKREDEGGDVELLSDLLGAEGLEQLDEFDRIQLAGVVRCCRSCRSLSEAGRRLFAVSRGRRRSVNDADRLAKYLARHGLGWQDVRGN